MRFVMRDLHCTHLIPTMQWSEHFSTQGLSHLDFPFKERETLGQNLYTSLYQVISLFPCQNETGPLWLPGHMGCALHCLAFNSPRRCSPEVHIFKARMENLEPWNCRSGPKDILFYKEREIKQFYSTHLCLIAHLSLQPPWRKLLKCLFADQETQRQSRKAPLTL